MRELLGWGESRILEWAKPWEELVRDDPPHGASALFSNAPAYYVLPLLIPQGLRQKLRRREIATSDVETELQHAIEDFQGLGCYSDPDYDWSAARRRVEAALAKYGEGSRNGDAASFSGAGSEKVKHAAGNKADGPGPTNERSLRIRVIRVIRG